MGKINDLIDWVATRIDTISDLTGSVYKYRVQNPDDGTGIAYPNATVVWGGTPEAEYISLKKTWRTYRYIVRINYEIGSDSRTLEGVESILYDLADEVIDTFEAKRGADGNALLLDGSIGATDWLDGSEQIRYCEVTLDFKVLRDAN